MKNKSFVVGMAALAAAAGSALGTITIGPYNFDDIAFADRAVQAEAGSVGLWGAATSVSDALVGYHLDRQIVNIGYAGAANLFDLYFDDLKAVDGAGTDIVLFDVRFSADPYEIAVTTDGGTSWSGFQLYGAAGQTATGANTAFGNQIFGIDVDIASYGLPANSIVDGIRFRALPNANGLTEGDPIMGAVLNGVPTPGSLGVLGLAALAAGRRRRLA